MEVSSKRAVGRHREVVQLQAVKRRDPRFDKLSGHFNQDLFEKSYGFINEYKKSEMEMLKERIKKEKDPDTQEKLQGLLTKMVNSLLVMLCIVIAWQLVYNNRLLLLFF
ncbi:MAG: hypothetical protein EXX96DRAFT_579922 [Benjaminiella poitrasii]|nr:MAG: hypothetical protein EXX96DRAFT_579922 [Benjaminiella poitrasii]